MIALTGSPTIGPEAHPSVPPAELIDETLNNPTCANPKCTDPFIRRRKDQRYCGRRCQQNAARSPRLIADSAEARRVHERRKGRVVGLSHAFYETPPAYRAEFMQRLIVEVRGNAELRRLVTLREILHSWTRDGGTGRLHIAHLLDHYCQEVYGQRSFVVVEPMTVLPSFGDLAFPAEYFGPDADPIYEDGSLKVRPCPWIEWKKERQSASTTIKGIITRSRRGLLRALSVINPFLGRSRRRTTTY